MAKSVNLIGQTFGRLTVIDKCKVNNRFYWLCQCSCGNITKVETYGLKSGRTQSCGCYRSQRIRERNTQYSTKHNRVISNIGGVITFEDEKHNQCMVDSKDWEYLKQWYWRKTKRGDRKKSASYWITNAKKSDLENGEGTSLRLHQKVIELKCGKYDKNRFVVDHLDRNIDNNTRKNLALKSNEENSHNRDISVKNTSGCTGVYKKGNKWYSKITVHYKNIFLGSFGSYEEAVKARRDAEVKYNFTCE